MAEKEDKKKKVKCSFCGKEYDTTETVMTQGIDRQSYICEDCLKELATSIENTKEYLSRNDTVQETKKLTSKSQVMKLPHPSEIKAYLDKYVIGQEQAKKILSVAVYNHYKMVAIKKKKAAEDNDVELQKSNILLIGQSGTGKTFLLESLSRFLKVPFVMEDASSFTESGYVGCRLRY